MDYKSHISISIIVNGIILFLLDKSSIISIKDIGVPSILIVIYIFSIISDIDHSESHISSRFHLGLYIGIFISIYVSYLITICILLIGIIHLYYGRDNWTHRRFPHTFSFGIIICIILFIISKSYILTLIGLISFVTHLRMDNYIEDAIRYDKTLWKSIIEIMKKPTAS